jgi:hypothetical protein
MVPPPAYRKANIASLVVSARRSLSEESESALMAIDYLIWVNLATGLAVKLVRIRRAFDRRGVRWAALSGAVGGLAGTLDTLCEHVSWTRRSARFPMFSGGQ